MAEPIKVFLAKLAASSLDIPKLIAISVRASVK